MRPVGEATTTAGAAATATAEATAGTAPVIPLCHPQQRVWFTELMAPGTGVGNLAGCLHLAGARHELGALHAAIERVVALHDALWLRLVPTTTPICAQVLGERGRVDAPVMVVDESRRALLEESQRPFALFDGPLFMFRLLELPGDRIGFFFKYHHIMVDAWTVSLLNKQIHQVFCALTGRGGSLHVGECPSFLEFFPREQAYLASQERVDDEAFWRAHLAGLAEAGPDLLGRGPAAGGLDLATQRFEHDFGAALTADIVALCKQQETTVFRFFLAVFALHFAGRTYDRDVVLSTGHHNRLEARDKAMVGMTVSTLPMRLRVDTEDRFVDLLRRVHGRSTDCLARQQYPYDLLAQHLRGEGHDPRRLLRYFINHIPSLPRRAAGKEGATAGGSGDYTVERYSPGADLAELNIKINPNQRPRGAPLQLCVDARKALFDEAAVWRMFARVEHLVRQVVADPQQRLVALDLLTPQERNGLASGGRRRPRPLLDGPSEGRLAGLLPAVFEQTAARFADRVAVVDERGTKTYATLQAEVQALAAALAARGVERGQRVALVMDRCADFLVAALGVMLAGAAYVPITPDTPGPRLAGILADAGVSLLLAEVDRPSPHPAVPVAVVGRLVAEGRRQKPPILPLLGREDLAYVIYTSGSTGAPKGVMIPHRALVNLCAWNADLLDLHAHDRAAAFCSFMFDVSVAELFTPLVRGATVVIVPEAVRRSVHHLDRFFAAQRITVATLPTRVGELFQAHVAGASLRVLTVAGETLRRVVPRDYRLINAYGPTEATVYATACDVRAGDVPIPIGEPADNTWTWVVDGYDRLVAPGEEGELLLAGEQVALGYLNQPEASQKVFIPNPFTTGHGDVVAYRTGDRVQLLPDGNLLFLGRLDRQLKQRGFRVEPEEVEACLRAHPAVDQCLVMARDDNGELAGLVAWCVTRGGVDEGALFAFARERLPGFMLPAELVLVPEIPLNRSGKTDLAALRALRGQATAAAGSEAQGRVAQGRVAPRSELERRLLAVFRAVLKRDDLGVDDSFFDSGGDSLRAMELFAELERRFGRVLPVSLIFQRPTVAALAAALSVDGEDGAVGAQLPDDMVLMKPGKQSCNLVFINDFSGDLMSYTGLVQHLDTPLNVYGMRWSQRISDNAASIEDVAALYLRSLRAVQPSGPYRLMGYSIGGTIAYEMARQLVADGELVAFLGLLDTPNYAQERQLLEAFLITLLRSALAWLRGMSLTYTLAYASARVGRIPSLRRIVDMLRAQRHMKNLAMIYRPGPANCELVLLRAAGERFGLGDDLGWRELVPAVHVYALDGDHISMMNEVRAPAMARLLAQLLAGTSSLNLPSTGSPDAR